MTENTPFSSSHVTEQRKACSPMSQMQLERLASKIRRAICRKWVYNGSRPASRSGLGCSGWLCGKGVSTMRIKHLIILVALVLAPVWAASPALAGGVVTVCDEARLLVALAGGGTVTFACSGTITLTNTITIATDTTIGGSGQDVTISGNDAVRVFLVNDGATPSLNELTITNSQFVKQSIYWPNMI